MADQQRGGGGKGGSEILQSYEGTEIGQSLLLDIIIRIMMV